MKKIGLLSPASSVSQSDLENSVVYWQKQGYEIVFSENLYAKNRFLAGTDQQRIDDLTALFADDSVDFIVAAGGGYGSGRILKKIDYDLIARHKKPFFGLSDTTALQMGLLAKSDLVSFLGYMMKQRYGKPVYPYTERSLFDCLSAHSQMFYGLHPCFKGETISGTLIGGCLSLVTSLVGTPFFPMVKDPILILEDLNEEPYVIDRMLTQMDNAGVFEAVKAVVFGTFINCKAKEKEDGTLDDVFEEWKNKMKPPCFFGFPYGHQPESAVWPIGGRAEINPVIGSLCVFGVNYYG